MFDISVGYDLEGIRSRRVVAWLESMRNARGIVDELRREIPDEFSAFRDYPFRTCLATAITLSTFHGTPAGDIARIGEFLIGDLGFHTVIKLNPPMLGRERVADILHGVLGYTDVMVNPDVYERDLPFDEAVDLVRRLQALAERRGLEHRREVRQYARGAQHGAVPQGARAVPVGPAAARAACGAGGALA